MDLLDRLLGHDVWTTRQLLMLCGDLPDEELDWDFDIAHRTVRATFDHTIYNIEAWTDSMLGNPLRGNRGTSVSQLMERLERATTDFQQLAADVRDGGRWDEKWTDPLDGKSRTYGGTIAHVITHSMHHRAQLLYMMRRLGIDDLPEGDVLSWETQLEPPQQE